MPATTFTPGGGGGPPTGAAGGVLGGTYPNPGFAADMATQGELDAHEADTTTHGVDTANVPSSGQKNALAGADGTPGTGNEYLTKNSLGSRAQAYADALEAIKALTPAADKLPYFSGATTAQLATLTAFVRTILDDADASAVLTTLGVSTFIKTLLDDADAAAARTTLGLIIGTDVAAIGSPALTGNPTAPTPASGDDDTSLATTAFVQAAGGGEAWIAPSFGTNWGNFGGGFQVVAYRKVSGVVKLRGYIKTTAAQSAGVALFTLPVGYRPAATSGHFTGLYRAASANYLTCELIISTAGALNAYWVGGALASGDYIFLDDIEVDVVRA